MIQHIVDTRLMNRLRPQARDKSSYSRNHKSMRYCIPSNTHSEPVIYLAHRSKNTHTQKKQQKNTNIAHLIVN